MMWHPKSDKKTNPEENEAELSLHCLSPDKQATNKALHVISEENQPLKQRHPVVVGHSRSY